MKIKYLLFALLAFIIVGCSEPDPMKESYIQDCHADGAATETCLCLFDYGKKNMSESAFMSSDFTLAYRNKNNILAPEDEDELILVDPDCIGMCETKPNPDYQEPPSREVIAMITMNAMDACF